MSPERLLPQRSARARLTRRAALRLAAAATAGGLATKTLPTTSATASGTAGTRGSPAQAPRSRFDAFDERIRTVMAETGVPGVAVGVLYQGEEYLSGFGVTNVDHPLPVDGDTLFQIGSVTKTFTMAAAMRLVEQGRLELDVPLRRYLPDLQLSDPQVAAQIAMRHLLTHTSGLPADDFAAMGGGDDALARYVTERVSRAPLLLPLGRYSSYSNIGFSLAGRVIEVVSGRSYETAIRELLFEPLGIEQATFFAEDAIVAATAAGHTVLDGQPYRQRPWALPRTANAPGGIVASARDVLRYARMWLRDGLGPDGARLLSSGTLALIGTPQAEAPASSGAFGLAWGLAEIAGVELWAHDGGTIGQNARLMLASSRDFAYCALTNVPDAGAILGAGLSWLLEQLLGVTVPPPPAPSSLELDAATLAAYAGRYDNPGEAVQTLRVRDGALELVSEITDPLFASVQPPLPPDPPKPLAFSAPDEVYVVETPGARGAFLRNPDGRIAGLFWSGRFYVRRD